VCTNTPIDSSGYTLLHAAVAWGRRDCTTLLLRSGLLATATVNGRTTIDLTVLDVPLLPAALLPSELSCTIVRCDDDLQAVMLLLLQCGAPVDAALMCSNSKYAAAVKQRIEQVTRELHASNTAHAVRARHTYTTSEQHEQQCSGTSAVANVATVKVQLVHAETRVGGQRVYTVNTNELSQLYTARGEQGLNVLLSMLVPPESFRTATTASTQAEAHSVKELHYNGKQYYNHVRNSRSIRNSSMAMHYTMRILALTSTGHISLMMHLFNKIWSRLLMYSY
jgi:hypothetical protein